MRPIPIPALNNIANHAGKLNSVSSSSLPSLISPKRENIRNMQKLFIDTITNISYQPTLSDINADMDAVVSFKLSGIHEPHSIIAKDMITANQNTHVILRKRIPPALFLLV